MQNAMTKWLASYFDVLFAANRVLHPGEKRLTDFAQRECGILPLGFPADVDELVRSAVRSTPVIGQHMDAMVQRLQSIITTS